MSIKTEIVITHEDASVDADALLLTTDTSNKLLQINKIINFFKSLRVGLRKATVKMQVAGVQASSTLTLSEVANDNTAVINGVTFTAKASPSGAAEFATSATDQLAAVALAAKINAHTSLDGIVTAAVTSTEASEVTALTCVADVASSLHETYFVLADEAGTVGFWMDVDGDGVAPTTGADRDVEITTVTADMTAAQVAGVVATAIDADSKFTAVQVGSTAVVTVTCVEPAAAADFADGDSGFTASVTTQGADAVVTVTAIDPGEGGNTITLTATGGITAGAAKLAGGLNGTEKTYAFGGA